MGSVLIILDGFGFSNKHEGNAVAQAQMPFWNSFITQFQPTLLNASGQAVGLPNGFDGNSEVGHRTIGAGCITPTILKKFHETIDNNQLKNNPVLQSAISKLRETSGRLHLLGLVSDAGVHSHDKHLHALINLAHENKIPTVTHAILDGRDTLPKSAEKYLARLDPLPTTVGSLHGRFFAMDRDNNFDRTQKSYDVLAGNSEATGTSWKTALQNSYERGETDEFVTPVLLEKSNKIQSNDGVLFFNFRSDRARQLTSAFLEKKTIETTFFITTTRYKPSFNNLILFEQQPPKTSLLDEIANQTKKPIFVIAETEKYAHVTYFFREASEKPHPLITQKLIPSIKAKTYEKNPEMSATSITKTVIESLSDPTHFYLINYANPDMVGHSGNLDATVKALKIVDEQLEILYKNFSKLGYTIFITSDHGNAEEVCSEGKIKTSHTANPIPFACTSNPTNNPTPLSKITPKSGLANIAGLILKTMGLKIPNGMEPPLQFK